MIRMLLSILACVTFSTAIAQTHALSLDAQVTKDYEKLKKGTTVRIDSVSRESVQLSSPATGAASFAEIYMLSIGDLKVPVKNSLEDRLAFQPTDIQGMWDGYMIGRVLPLMQKFGPQTELREEREGDVLQYLQRIKSNGQTLNDPCLEYYLYGLLAKIAPRRMIDGRPYHMNVTVCDDPTANAAMYPNGTLVLNTGLLAALHTEDELVAILAHETAHYVLDHSIQNINKMVQRQKRAEFWAALATGVTAVAEGVAAAKSPYYVPGAATLGVAVLSSTIATEVIKRLGMEYNHQQELEADLIAKKVLHMLGYEKNALATALNRLSETIEAEHGKALYFASYTHPELASRIRLAGDPQPLTSNMFERQVSFAVTETARLKYEAKRFGRALDLVSQNIANNVATPRDYLLKAYCLLALHDTPQTNEEALEAVARAKELDPNDLNGFKAEIVVRLRMRQIGEAVQLLEAYRIRLENELAAANPSTGEFAAAELTWAKHMRIKLAGMYPHA